jgi:hypothetical protein
VRPRVDESPLVEQHNVNSLGLEFGAHRPDGGKIGYRNSGGRKPSSFVDGYARGAAADRGVFINYYDVSK